jgi:hypothetical protein
MKIIITTIETKFIQNQKEKDIMEIMVAGKNILSNNFKLQKILLKD